MGVASLAGLIDPPADHFNCSWITRIDGGNSIERRNLQRVRFVQARVSSVSLNGDMLIVSYSVEQGLAGRPSSYAVGRQLVPFMR